MTHFRALSGLLLVALSSCAWVVKDTANPVEFYTGSNTTPSVSAATSGAVTLGPVGNTQPHTVNGPLGASWLYSPVNYNGVNGDGGKIVIEPTHTAIYGSNGGALQADSGGNVRGAHATDLQRTRSAATQVASGLYSLILGGSGNTASGEAATVVGGYNNTVASVGGFVGAGYGNTTLTGTFNNGVLAGFSNQVNANDAVVVSGFTNITAGGASGIVSGANNTISSGADRTFIGGGHVNRITAGINSVIAGGFGNKNRASGSAISGGEAAITSGFASNVGGGQYNGISSASAWGSITGGIRNTIGGVGFIASEVSTATDTITKPSAHGLSDGQSGVLDMSGSSTFGGLVDGTTYFIVGSTATTFQLSLTSGGPAVDITSTGDGLPSLAMLNLYNANSAAVLGGFNNTVNGVSATAMGTGNLIETAATGAVAAGRYNRAGHSHAIALGNGAQTIAAADLVLSGTTGVTAASTANNMFRVDGAAENVIVGREINQSAVAGATNQLRLQTTNASNQSNFIAHQAGQLTASSTYTWPNDGTSGQVLTTNGSGALSWASSSAPSIGGAITSGTAGSLLFVDPANTFAQDNANLFWDNANNRLGIGTGTPGSQLTVLGSSAGVLSRVTNTSAAGGIGLFVENTNAASSGAAFSAENDGVGYAADFISGFTGDVVHLQNYDAGSRHLVFENNDNNTVGLKIPFTGVTNYNLTLPVDDGAAGQMLTTDGSGALSWVGILPLDSAASAGGSATESLTVAGLLTTDTVLSVTQRVVGGNNVAVTAFGSPGAGSLSVTWTADPGPGNIVRVLVKR